MSTSTISASPNTANAPRARAPVPGGQPFLVRNFPLVIVSGLLILLGLLIAHIDIGTADISVADIVKVLTGQKVESVTYTIIHELRLPRALVALLAGAMLALAGAIMQAVTRNPLADPDLTGASSGAVFFAVLWLSRQLFYRSVAPPDLSVPAVAMAGSILTAGFVYVMSRGRDRQTNTIRMILIAVMVSAIMRSLTSLILLVNQNATSAILTWLIGSLNGDTWEHWDTLWPWAAFALPVGLACAGVANVLHLGDDIAMGLGLRVERARLLLLFVAVLLTAAPISVVGGLGFIGLMSPHIARRLVGNDSRRVFPLSVIIGAIILTVADILTSTLINTTVPLPVGAVLTLVGTPFLIYLLRRGMKRG